MGCAHVKAGRVPVTGMGDGGTAGNDGGDRAVLRVTTEIWELMDEGDVIRPEITHKPGIPWVAKPLKWLGLPRRMTATRRFSFASFSNS